MVEGVGMKVAVAVGDAVGEGVEDAETPGFRDETGVITGVPVADCDAEARAVEDGETVGVTSIGSE